MIYRSILNDFSKTLHYYLQHMDEILRFTFMKNIYLFVSPMYTQISSSLFNLFIHFVLIKNDYSIEI